MTRPARPGILHVLEAVGHGTARHLLDLVATVSSYDHIVVLPASPTTRGQSSAERLDTPLRALGAHVHAISLHRTPTRSKLRLAVRRTCELASQTQVVAIHGHATVGGIVARLAAPRTGLPCVHTPHGVRVTTPSVRLERRLATATDVIVAVSSTERALLASLGVTPRQELVTVPNGIDLTAPRTASRDLRSELGLADRPMLGWIGRVARQKAPDVLVEAVRHLPQAHAVLVGGGPRMRRLAGLVRRRRLTDRVHLLGHVPEAAGLLPQFDVVALPSRWEGAPYVPLEAFRAGVPVVATDVTGTRDVVRDGDTGWLVPVDDPIALAEAMDHALRDRDEARRRAARATTLLVGSHDVETMGRRTAAIYHRLTASAGVHG